MAADLGKAYVQIVPSADGIEGSITHLLGGESKKAGISAGKGIASGIVGKLGGALAALGIGKVVGDTINKSLTEGGALQQSIGGIQKLFGEDVYAQVKKNADAAFSSAGLSANSYMEQVTGFAATLINGLEGDTVTAAKLADVAIRDMADNANTFGTDMSSIQNAYQGFAKQNYTMLDNLKLGYGGTAAEMARLINETGVMNDGIEYTAQTVKNVPFDKMIEGIHKVQEDLNITGTTSKEAAGTFEGSLNSMKASAQNLLANMSLGEDIKPSLDALLGAVKTFFMGNLIPMLGNILMSFPDILSGLHTMIIEGIQGMADNTDAIAGGLINIVTRIGTELLTMTPYLLEAVWNLITGLFETLVTYDWTGLLQSLGTTIKDNFTVMLGDVFGAETFSGALENITAGAQGIIENLANGITENLPGLTESAGEILDKIVSGIGENLPKILESGVQIITSILSGIAKSFPTIVQSAGGIIRKIVTTIVENLPQIFQTGTRLLMELLAGLIKAIPAILKGIWDLGQSIIDTLISIDWLKLGGDIIDGIANGLMEAGSVLWDACKDVARQAFDAVKSFFKIGSPSKLMEDEIGHWIPPGIAVGVEGNLKPIRDAMQEVSDTVMADSLNIPQMTYENEQSGQSDPARSGAAITIIVNGAEGQDVEELAKAVERRLTDSILRGNAAYA